MFELEVKSRQHFTYQDAHNYARISTDAFRNDLLSETLWSIDEKLEDEAIPPLIDYEVLKVKLDWFQRKVDYKAHRAYCDLLKSNHDRIFLLKELATHKYVAASYLTLPTYAVTAKVPLTAKLRSAFWGFVYQVYNLFARVPSYDGMIEDLHVAIEKSGVGKHHLHDLKNMDAKQLEEVVYPVDLSCMLHIFTVRTDQHGKGVGRIFMEKIIEYLKENVGSPPELPNGPPKLLLQSTPKAQAFYERLGFHCLMKFDEKFGDVVVPMATYYRNL